LLQKGLSWLEAELVSRHTYRYLIILCELKFKSF
jgi:hypothetical protein